MMGRLKDTLWWLPMWMAISMGLYLGAVKAVGVNECQKKSWNNTDE